MACRRLVLWSLLEAEQPVGAATAAGADRAKRGCSAGGERRPVKVHPAARAGRSAKRQVAGAAGTHCSRRTPGPRTGRRRSRSRCSRPAGSGRREPPPPGPPLQPDRLLRAEADAGVAAGAGAGSMVGATGARAPRRPVSGNRRATVWMPSRSAAASRTRLPPGRRRGEAAAQEGTAAHRGAGVGRRRRRGQPASDPAATRSSRSTARPRESRRRARSARRLCSRTRSPRGQASQSPVATISRPHPAAARRARSRRPRRGCRGRCRRRGCW